MKDKAYSLLLKADSLNIFAVENSKALWQKF